MNEWISVKDKMPEKQKTVLLYQTYPAETMFNCRSNPLSNRCFIIVGGLSYDGKFLCYSDQYHEIGLKHISHWMELPKPPEEI